MNCINIKSPEFKALAEATGIAEHDLDFKIAQWQDATGSFEFPTAQQLAETPAQITPEQKSAELDVKIKDFLQVIGVSVETVSELKDSQGNPIQGVALANLLDRVIQVTEGKAGLDTLPEEAAHFFVEMLPKDSHIYQTMYNSIDKYEIYKTVVEEYGSDPAYANNPEKLRKEAMGKLIAQHIVSQYQGNETAANMDKANKWWNLLWNWVKNKMFKLNKEAFYKTANEYDAFKESADRIIAGDASSLAYSNIEDLTQRFYQKESDAATSVKNIIESKNENVSYNEDKKVYEQKVEGTVRNISKRVSQRVESATKGRFAERNEQEKIQDEKSRQAGTQVHNALNNIIKRFAESLNGNVVTAPEKFGVTDRMYQQLNDYASNLMKGYPAGTIFLSETIIYDQNADEAGTIDFIAINPDGKVDIYDWKTINLFGKKEIPFYKEENWNIQLGRYKTILKGYGIKNFGKLRVIPIATTFNKQGEFAKIQIGTEELEQIPMTGLKGGEIEETGVEAIDKLVEVLTARMKKLIDMKIPYEDVKRRNLRIDRVEKLKATIKELQMKNTFDNFLEDGIFEMNLLKNTGIENLTNEELVDAKNLMEFYARIVEKEFVEEGLLKNKFAEFAKLQTAASAQLAKIDKEMEKRAVQTANSLGVDNLLDPQKEIGFWKRLFRSISQSEHPIIQSFYRLVMSQKDKVYKESRALQSRIQFAKQDLEEWGRANGLSGTDIYNPFLQMKDGKWTGNLVNKYSPDFYNRRSAALKSKTKEDLDWLTENTNFNQAKYDEMLAQNMQVWIKIYGDPKTDAKADALIAKKLDKFEKDFNVKKHPFTAFGNKKNFLVTPKEQWQSAEFRKIMSTPALKNFYELFTSTIREHSNYLDLGLKESFVPNVKTDYIDKLAQNGFGSASGMKDAIASFITVNSEAGYGMVDEVTGEIKKSVPIFYTSAIAPKEKSKDLGSSLYLFANMASNHKYMSEIEASANMFKDLLENRSKTIMTDALGRPIERKLTGKVQEYLNSSNTIEMFNNYMDHYLYGISASGKSDVTVKAEGAIAKALDIEGKNVSLKKMFSGTLKFFGAKALTLNMLSAVANGFGGSANAFMEGAKGRFYTKRHYANGLKMLATKNDKAYQLIEFFDIESDHTDFQKALKLSASKISKSLTFDKLYIAQKVGDWPVENGVLLAMLQTHTLKNGKIVKMKEGETSLMEMAKIENDAIKIEGLTDEEFGKFRRKVKYLYTTMKGNNANEDISAIKLSLIGQALMQFKNWIPRMADERFGELRYTQDLDTWEEGKYRTMLKHMSGVVSGNFKGLVTGLASYGFLGFGKGIASASIKEAAMRKYQDLPADQKDKMTAEQYAEMYQANLRAAAMEMQLIIATIVMFGLLKGDDDDDKTPLRRYMVKVANRNFQELSFFTNPKSFMEITGGATKSFVPVVGLAGDLYNFTGSFLSEGVYAITGDEAAQEKNKPMKYFYRLFPVTNSVEHFYSSIQSNK